MPRLHFSREVPKCLMDFVLWAYLKRTVFVNKPNSSKQFKNKIRCDVQEIRYEMIPNVLRELKCRLADCQEVAGQFKHLIKSRLE